MLCVLGDLIFLETSPLLLKKISLYLFATCIFIFTMDGWLEKVYKEVMDE